MTSRRMYLEKLNLGNFGNHLSQYFLGFFFGAIALFSSMHFVSASSAPVSPLEMPEKPSSEDRRETPFIPRENLTRYFGLATHGDIENFSQQACGDVLATAPPPWFDRLLALSHASLPHAWGSVSTMQTLHFLHWQNPRASVEQVANSYGSRLLTADENCQPLPSTLSASPRAEVTRTLPLYARSATARDELLATGREEIERAITFFCPTTDAECRSFFEATDLRFCNLPGTAPCRYPAMEYDATVHFLNTDANLLNPLNLGPLREEIRSRMRIHQPYININVEMDPRIYRPRLVFRHELGHALSRWERYRQARYGTGEGAVEDVTVGMDWYRRLQPGRRCLLDENGLRIYKRLFREQGASNETVTCILDRIHQYPRGRFSLSPDCREICAYRQLEESFADWTSWKMTSDPQGIIDQINWEAAAKRDADHPLGLDTTNCFMLTDSVRQAVRQATRCRE